jgi:hypothetical protein
MDHPLKPPLDYFIIIVNFKVKYNYKNLKNKTKSKNKNI